MEISLSLILLTDRLWRNMDGSVCEKQQGFQKQADNNTGNSNLDAILLG